MNENVMISGMLDVINYAQPIINERQTQGNAENSEPISNIAVVLPTK